MTSKRRVQLIPVHQWMGSWTLGRESWDQLGTPPGQFFIGSIRVGDLLRLADTHVRNADPREASRSEHHIQRKLRDDRRSEIERFIEYGFPYSEMGKRQASKEESARFVKPGWLPTAIVTNLIGEGQKRKGVPLAPENLLEIRGTKDSGYFLEYELDEEGLASRPSGLKPLEVIDGQHRLAGFERKHGDVDYELPVVIFDNLSLNWQAYLFYVINIKPTKINLSLAFDLFPMLRTEEWLDPSGQLAVYRETRAQSIVQALWDSDDSPWAHHINLLGDRGLKGQVSQAAWINSLSATLLRSPKSREPFPGIFMGAEGTHQPVGWPAAQEVAFIIGAGRSLQASLAESRHQWTQLLAHHEPEARPPAAMFAPSSLLATDQGLRAWLWILNDIAMANQEQLGLRDWRTDVDLDKLQLDDVHESLGAIPSALRQFLNDLSLHLASFNWMTSQGPELAPAEVETRKAYRGTGGYRLLMERVRDHIVGGGLIDENLRLVSPP